MLPQQTFLSSKLTLMCLSFAVLYGCSANAEEVSSPFKGPYLGLEGGYATSSPTFESDPYSIDIGGETVPIPGRNDELDLNGFQGGIHAGYNFINQSNFMIGVEADLTYLGLEDTTQIPVTRIDSVPGTEPFDVSYRSELELEWQSTVRLRTGYVANKTLFYGTAGIAFAGLDWEEQATIIDVNGAGGTIVRNHSDRDILIGYALGTGVQHAITPKLSIGASYLYENFGDSDSLPFGHTAPAQRGSIDDLDIHKISLRLTYKFGDD